MKKKLKEKMLRFQVHTPEKSITVFGERDKEKASL